ncbi:MAG: nuclear transport factor 2 family protein [Rhodocyclaceae bacterium]|nr:nuclear transport factor 2 family protein [Rhodocyclaceae bacterium]
MSPELARVVDFYETLGPEGLEAALAAVYAEEASFVDPFNAVVGRAKIAAIFRHMFQSLESPRFEVVETWQREQVAVLRWVFEFRFRQRRERVSVEGMSRLVFDPEGRVCEHVDHWDASSQFYTRLPFLGPLMRLLRRLVCGRSGCASAAR